MSIVPPTGILRKCYEEAAIDIEYKSSRFWQAWLQRAFNDPDIYNLSCEISPDGSLRRVDMVVERYDAHHHTLSAVLWVEAKRPTGSVRQVEGQALDAAMRCIKRDGLEFVYVMTTVGLSFRAWKVYDEVPALQPEHGTPVEADRMQYINADSDEARVLSHFVTQVKSYPPLRRAPVLPSQSLSQEEYEVYAGVQEGYIGGQGGYPSGQQGYAGEADGQGSASGMVYQNDQAEASTSWEYGQASTGNSEEYVKVQVERVAHLTRPNEYFYKDVKGQKRTTTKNDWKGISYNGRPAWTTRRKGVNYYTRDTIG
jgi:hypothetical protein